MKLYRCILNEDTILSRYPEEERARIESYETKKVAIITATEKPSNFRVLDYGKEHKEIIMGDFYTTQDGYDELINKNLAHPSSL